MAYFLNNLSVMQQTRLQMSMNKFELKVLTDEGFREKVSQELGE
jgi:hypothetical protein